VKQGVVVSKHYSQVAMLRTIEDVLGTEHLNLNTAYQRPMTEVFNKGGNGKWTFTAQASTVLAGTTLASVAGVDGTRYAAGPMIHPQHDAAFWDAATAGFNFEEADQVPPERFNRILWAGLMGGRPYPVRGDAPASKDGH
jgi:hypothetical protein